MAQLLFLSLIITQSVYTVFGDTLCLNFVSFFGFFPLPRNFCMWFFYDSRWQEGPGTEESPEEGTVLPHVSGLRLCTGARPAPSPPSGPLAPPRLWSGPARARSGTCQVPAGSLHGTRDFSIYSDFLGGLCWWPCLLYVCKSLFNESRSLLSLPPKESK